MPCYARKIDLANLRTGYYLRMFENLSKRDLTSDRNFFKYIELTLPESLKGFASENILVGKFFL
jgi:hypothetical protein